MQDGTNNFVIAAFVSGGFAFIGAIFGNAIGQFLNRRTQRESWLLKQRAEAFHQFWIEFEAYKNDIIRIDEEFPNDSMSYGKHSSAAFRKLQTCINIVSLYLPKNTRQRFREKINFLANFTPDFTHPITPENLKHAYKPYFDCENEISNILESNLPVS